MLNTRHEPEKDVLQRNYSPFISTECLRILRKYTKNLWVKWFIQFQLFCLAKINILKGFSSLNSSNQFFFFFSVQQMKLKNHSQSSNPTKLQLIQTVPTEQRQLCWGWDSRGAARGVFVLSATPTPCTGTRFSWTSPKSQECIKIKWISNPQNESSHRGELDFCVLYSLCVYSKLSFFKILLQA